MNTNLPFRLLFSVKRFGQNLLIGMINRLLDRERESVLIKLFTGIIQD